MATNKERELEREMKRTLRRARPPNEAFWSKVCKSDGCWNWIASVDHKGYGKFHVPGTPGVHSLRTIACSTRATTLSA